ncbi:hypothetical protein L6164_015396 [Bauhinia variegata]|uniref:Uncharacterized protein n=1 Tax=Bauhinia variegata TaxID=167791 RepID=A0ACB9NKH0_BAUVA|nr:hypothetical protein L6164_015396 [Bauhinia variegata]
MMRKTAKLLLIFLVYVLPVVSAQVNNRSCRRTCGSDKTYRYPFGFSSGCDIQLNCTHDAVFVEEFPVQSVGQDTIIVNVMPKCNRPIDSFRQLFGHKYAPTARNALLLQNCIDRISPCLIPKTMVQTHFDSLDCTSGSGNLSCYSDNTTRGFMNYDNITNSRCQYLMSSIMADRLSNSSATSTPVSLEVAAVELGWWLQGDCKCSSDANCTKFDSPANGKPAYRCRCNQGFVGDGYSSGTGCRKGQFFKIKKEN